MPRINYVKSTRKDQGSCGKCGDPLPKKSAYRWIKFRYGGKRVRCMKASCSFRQSDLTSSDKLSRAYAASETIQDAVGRFVSEVHVSEILEKAQAVVDAVEEAKAEIEEVAQEYTESADNIEQYFEGSATAEECREKADELENWGYEFDSPLSDLQSEIESLEEYISTVEASRDEEVEDADIIVTTVEGLTDMMMGDEEVEPFDTSGIEGAISEIENMSSECPV